MAFRSTFSILLKALIAWVISKCFADIVISTSSGRFMILFKGGRQNLLSRWPGCYIPAIPPKKVVGNMDPKFIESRRKHLNSFCNDLATLPYIWYGEEFDIFIRSSNPELNVSFDALP